MVNPYECSPVILCKVQPALPDIRKDRMTSGELTCKYQHLAGNSKECCQMYHEFGGNRKWQCIGN